MACLASMVIDPGHAPHFLAVSGLTFGASAHGRPISIAPEPLLLEQLGALA